MRKLKAWHIPFGVIFWPSHVLREVSTVVDSQALEKSTKSVQPLSRVGSAQSRAHVGQFSQNTALAPEGCSSISIQTPFLPLPFLFGLPLAPTPPESPQPHPWSASFDWPGSSAHGIFGVWWALASFPCLDFLKLLMPLLWQELGSAEMKVINPQDLTEA